MNINIVLYTFKVQQAKGLKTTEEGIGSRTLNIVPAPVGEIIWTPHPHEEDRTCRVAFTESLMSITRPAFTTTFGSLFRNWSMLNFFFPTSQNKTRSAMFSHACLLSRGRDACVTDQESCLHLVICGSPRVLRVLHLEIFPTDVGGRTLHLACHEP